MNDMLNFVRLTRPLLARISGAPEERLTDELVKALNRTMMAFGVTTLQRQAHFLAQLTHESGAFRYTEEIASGEAYEGRLDLGNTEPGDGVRFKGRGYIQITGRSNVTALSIAIGRDFVSHPEQLSVLPHSATSAGWFWKTRGLNELADEGDVRKVTRRINGGYNGLNERVALTEHAIRVLTEESERRAKERADPGVKLKPLPPLPIAVSPPQVPTHLDYITSDIPAADNGNVSYVFDRKPKWIGFSKTFIGILITALGIFGKDIPYAKDLLANTDSLIEIIGLLVALYGTVVRKQRVVLWPKAKDKPA